MDIYNTPKQATQSPSSDLIIGTLCPACHQHHRNNSFQRLNIPFGWLFPLVTLHLLISHSTLHETEQIPFVYKTWLLRLPIFSADALAMQTPNQFS